MMVMQALKIYADTYEKMLACPVVKGVKSEKEKFAGGYMTTTVEAFIPTNGRAVQGATSHHLGQNFSKMFKIQFENEDGKKEFASQTSWGFTTRSIGTMIMIHGDNKGLVCPPRVAEKQIVIVPVPGKKMGVDELGVKCHELAEKLRGDKCARAIWGGPIRVHVDDRKNYNPGYKYNHWELKGVPIRLELGERDMQNESVFVATRYNNQDKDYKKFNIAWKDLEDEIPKLLDRIHDDMLTRATEKRDDSIVVVRPRVRVL